MLLLRYVYKSIVCGRRWLDEHGDMARMVQDIQESKQQLQAAMEEQAKQLEEHKQQLKDQQAK